MTTWKGRYWSVSFHRTGSSVTVPLLALADSDELADVELDVSVRFTVAGWKVAPGDAWVTMTGDEDELMLAGEACWAPLDIKTVLDWADVRGSKMAAAITRRKASRIVRLIWSRI